MTRNRRIAYTLLILTLIPWVVWGIIVVMLIQNPYDPAALEPTSGEPLPFWMWATMLVSLLTIGLMIYFIAHLYKRSGLPGTQRALWLALIVFTNILAMPFYWYNYVWSRRDDAAGARSTDFPQATMAEDPNRGSTPPFSGLPDFSQLRGPRGIGGWLLLFTVGQIVSLVLNVFNAADLSGFSGPAWALGETISVYRPILVSEELCAIVASVGGSIGLYLLLRKRPQAPRFYVAFLAFFAGYGLLEVGGVALLYPKLIAFAQAAGNNSNGLAELQSSQTVVGLRQVVYGLVWLLYWRSSRRVANTFEPVDSAAVTIDA